jgi:16S rRNA C1402 N4-methylase RsmH
MTKEILCAFEPVSEGIYIDATFGAGGHSKALLDNGAAEIFAIDRDPHAVIGAQTMIEESDNRLSININTLRYWLKSTQYFFCHHRDVGKFYPITHTSPICSTA